MRRVAAIINHQFGCLHAILVFAEPMIAAWPGEAAFDNPRQSGDLEGALSSLHEFAVSSPETATHLAWAYPTDCQRKRIR